MLNEIFKLIPGITVGKILIQRDETTKEKTANLIYTKFPHDIADKKRVFVLDPMLGTGGSICMCIS